MLKKFTKSRIILSILFILFIWGCQKNVNLQNLKEELIEVDKEFSALSVEIGTAKAFYHYMAEDGVVLPQKGNPVSKDQYKKEVEKRANEERRSILTWGPEFADVSRRGDIGYTFGKYILVSIDSGDKKNTTVGYYVTIWKKQADGQWKFVFDTGNKTE